MYKVITVLVSIISIVSCAENSPTKKTFVQVEESDLGSDSIKTLSLVKDENQNLTQLEFDPKIEMKSLLISSGQVSAYTDIVMANCKFQLVQNQNRDTVYLSTNDPRFVTPEGYKVGDDWEVIANNDAERIGSMPGWGYFIKLESGWQLGFCEGQSCTDRAPKNGSLVKWVFKREAVHSE